MSYPCLSSFCESAWQPCPHRCCTDQDSAAAAPGLWPTQNMRLGEHGAEPVRGHLPLPKPAWRLSGGSFLSCGERPAQRQHRTSRMFCRVRCRPRLPQGPSCGTQDTGQTRVPVPALVYIDVKTAGAPEWPSWLSGQLLMAAQVMIPGL